MKQTYFCDECVHSWKAYEIGDALHCPTCGSHLQEEAGQPLIPDEDKNLNIVDLLRKYGIEYSNNKYHWQSKTYASYKEPLAIIYRGEAQQKDDDDHENDQNASDRKEKIVIAAIPPEEIPLNLDKNPLPMDTVLLYDHVDQLKEDILSDKIEKNFAVRKKNIDGRSEEIQWRTIEDAASDIGLEELYKSKAEFIKKYSRQGTYYGFMTALTIFAVIACIRFYLVLPELSIMWVFFVSGLYIAQKVKNFRIIIYVLLLALPRFFGLKSSVFGVFLGSMVSIGILSAVYGIPLGMIMGTIWGLRKEKKKIYAPDADRNSKGILMKDIVVPSCCLVIAGIAHYFLSIYFVQHFTGT